MGEGSGTGRVHLLPGAGDPEGTEGSPGPEEGSWKSCVEPETVGRPPAGTATAARQKFLGEISECARQCAEPQHTRAHTDPVGKEDIQEHTHARADPVGEERTQEPTRAHTDPVGEEDTQEHTRAHADPVGEEDTQEHTHAHADPVGEEDTQKHTHAHADPVVEEGDSHASPPGITPALSGPAVL